MEVQLDATVTVEEQPRNNSQRERDSAALFLSSVPDAVGNIVIERFWLDDSDATKLDTIGLMLYHETYEKVRTNFRNHSLCFKNTFDKSLALFGGFDAIEKFYVAGGDRFCDKTMIARILSEKSL